MTKVFDAVVDLDRLARGGTVTDGDALAAQTLALVDVPSVSRDEAAIVDEVRAVAATGDAFDLVDDEDTCSCTSAPPSRRAAVDPVRGPCRHRADRGERPGAQGRRRSTDGGAADKKAGIAVMLALRTAVGEGTARRRTSTPGSC